MLLCRKRKNGYPNSGYPYPTRISGYLPGSTRSVSDPNPKLYYQGITRIRPEYKNTRIRIRKIVPNQYPYPVPISGTLPVFTPTRQLEVHIQFALCDFKAFKALVINYLVLKDHKLPLSWPPRGGKFRLNMAVAWPSGRGRERGLRRERGTGQGTPRASLVGGCGL
jgi:hypothetical protein